MTTIPPASASGSAAETGKSPSPADTGTMSPEVRGRSSGSGLQPDFVDERIRAEMASLQQDRGFEDYDEEDGEYWDGEEGDESEYDYSSDETPDEFDEADLQQLTRERGFGLGSWIDRLVEWTLFGVEEWPVHVPSTASATRIGTTSTTTTVTFEEPLGGRSEWDQDAHDTLSLASESDFDTLSHADEAPGDIEKPGSQGGWEDAGWLFRVVKRAIV